MTQILRTTRRLPLETLELERFDSMDGQGAPSYDTAIDIEANVVEYDASATGKGASFVTVPDGSQVHTPLTLYMRGDATVVPSEQDRITLSDGRAFIVVEKKPVSGLRKRRTEPDHYRLRLRVE